MAEGDSGTIGRGEPTRYLLALLIGALVGVGLAATYPPAPTAQAARGGGEALSPR